MRSHAIVLSICILGALPAHAEECSRTLSSAIYNRYAFAEIGQIFYDRPVIQTDAALTCGDMTYDLWNSSQFEGSGSYGHRGQGDELDLTATWNHSYESEYGPIEIELSGAYWLIDSFGRMKDDYLAFHEQVGRPFVIDDSITITPYLRASQWEGFDGSSYLLVRPGVSASWKMAEGWQLGADASWTADIRNHADTPNVTFTLSHDLGGTWGIFASAGFASGMPPVIGGGLRASF